MSKPTKLAHGLSYQANFPTGITPKGNEWRFMYTLHLGSFVGSDDPSVAHIRTPAQQLIVKPGKEKSDRPINGKYPLGLVYHIHDFFRDWLTQNTRGWGMTEQIPGRKAFPDLYFENENDLLEFVALVDQHLSPLKLPE